MTYHFNRTDMNFSLPIPARPHLSIRALRRLLPFSGWLSILLFVTPFFSLAQTFNGIIPFVPCHLSGTNPVTEGNTYTFTAGGCSAITSATTSCGTVQSFTSTTITVNFNQTGCSSATIAAYNGSFIIASLTVTVIQPLVPGTISNPSQTINYNTTPSQINCSAATGGQCSGSYSYQWYSSTDNVTFTAISGATGQNYQPGPLTTTTYFKQGVTCASESGYSNTATVTVYPQLNPGTISPSSQTINYNTTPSGMSLGGVSGGDGSYAYLWQVSSDNSTWSNSHDNGTTFTTGNLTQTAYYRVQVTSNGVTAYSPSATVTVYPQLVPGSVSPGSQTINYNTTPSSMTLSGISGGSGTYTYQWYSNASGTYQPLSGATATTYSPAALMSTTSYYVAVTSNGATLNSGTVTITVYPQLVSGSISPSSQTINYNRLPTGLSVSSASGGNGTYTYTWYSAPSSSGTYTQIGTGTTYSPSYLTATTYYEVVTASNGVNVTSMSAVVTVNPQVFPGIIIPAVNTIASGTSPGALTATAASGGACGSFSYQWQNSPNNSTWSNISGATSLTYSSGSLSATTFYRVRVICGTDTEYTAIGIVNVGTATPEMNYVRTRTLLKAGVTDTATADTLSSTYDFTQSTVYSDGLGRPVQTVALQQTPLLKDLVKPEDYDNFGRQSIKYLPYAATTSDGAFKPTALADQFTFNSAQFPGEQYYYGQITFEASTLNRPLQTEAAGISWTGSDRGSGAQYLVNTASDSVQRWGIGAGQLSLPIDSGAYQAGQLFKAVKVDEMGNQAITYKDKWGKVILVKAQITSSPSTGHSGWLCTYYVYDSLQSLRLIIQPKAVDLINGSWTVTQTIANALCFRYEYDGRKNKILTGAPGAGNAVMVYDARNRLVLKQDSSLRSAHKWLFIKYDSENRADSTGLITDPSNYSSPAYHDSLAYYSTNYPAIASYTNELLTENFYDDYTWVSTYSAPVSAMMATNYTSSSTYFITSYNTAPVYAVANTPFKVIRGMTTGSMKKVIGTSSQFLYTSYFYDDRGRVIQTQSVNYTGGIDTVTMQYNFSGKILRTLVNHRKSGNTAQNHIVLTKIDYDQSMRPRHTWKNIDGAASDQLIDSLQYNELGQLRAKYLGNNVDSLIYDYNLRGWLTAINKNYISGTTNHYFGLELGYDKTSSAAAGNTYVTPQYNGNVEGTVWKTAGSGMNRKYDYSYDNAGRLTSAAYLQNTAGSSWDNSQVDFSVGNLSYDANGNILTMEQKGFLVGGSQFIDQLKYTYPSNGNLLGQVYDSANNPTTLLGDFHWSGTKQASDYSYDGNGNLIQDNNRSIDTIGYNYLNLAQNVHMIGKGRVTYVYDASGGKLAKTITDSLARHSITILYIGGFIYQQTDTITNPGGGTDSLQYIIHEEGRTRWAFHKYTTGATGYKFEYDFFEKDYLGNTRMVLTQERDTSNYLASMEAAYRSTESQLFANIASTSYAWISVPNYAGIPTGTLHAITNPNDSVSKVDSTGAGGQKTGPSLLLKVMSGDTISMAVQAFYNSNSDTTTNSSFSDVLNSLAAGLVSTATGQTEGSLSGFTSSSGPVYGGLSSFLSNNRPAPPSGYPKAYLNWIFLDDQFNYISGSSGAVSAASSTYPSGQLNTIAPGSALNITRNGYLYIWVSNETTGWDVFFDNLSVQHKQGPLLEENHYYPFGLTQAGISDKAIKTQYVENKYRYNGGSELQNKEFSDGSGLELYDANVRSYDPQVGRFFQIDPMADKLHVISPYVYALGNPALNSDPSGAFPRPQVNPTSDYYAALLNSGSDGMGDWDEGGGGPAWGTGDEGGGFGGGGNTPDLNTIISMLMFSQEGGTWTNNGNGTGSYSFVDDPSQEYLNYPVYGANGSQIGMVDILIHDALDDNHGIQIVLGYTDFGSGYDVTQLNWMQTIVTDDPLGDHSPNVPYLDCKGTSCPYYYPVEMLPDFYPTGKYGKDSPVPEDLLFGDTPERTASDYYWLGTLSLVVMGPNASPSQTLLTMNYGFNVSQGIVTSMSYPPSPYW